MLLVAKHVSTYLLANICHRFQLSTEVVPRWKGKKDFVFSRQWFRG
jgi:hypothetical protein